MKNVGMCLDLGGEGKGYVFGEWNLERKQEFLQSILDGFGVKANVREDGGFGGVVKAECCMCGATYKGYGHNAQPIYNARCCDDCNALVLIGRLNLREKGDDIYSHIHTTIQKFPSQKSFTWTALKEKVKSFSKGGRSGATLDFNPVKVVAEASEKRRRDEKRQEREFEAKEQEYWRRREERERQEKIEAERKAKKEAEKAEKQKKFEGKRK